MYPAAMTPSVTIITKPQLELQGGQTPSSTSLSMSGCLAAASAQPPGFAAGHATHCPKWLRESAHQ